MIILQLPVLSEVKRKIKPQVITFNGLNRNPLISDDELAGCTNLSFKDRPCLSCRSPRETLYTLTTPKALFSVGTALAWVDGTAFKYNNTTKGTVTAGQKSMVDFNGKIVIMPDKKSYDYGTDTFATIGSGTYPAAGSCPDMDYICVHMNRVFGVKGNDIYACALGNVTDWTTFAGLSTDAWAADVESEGGSFTGIVSYQNHPVLFKTDLMYEIYGNKPSNFTTQKAHKVGCISNLAIIEIDGVLYFVGKKGVYAYTGGTPRLISIKLDETYSDAVLGTDGRILYASLYNGSEWKLYIYDTWEGNWLKEDSLHVVQFTRIGEHAHALSSTGALYKFNSGTETGIPWELETKQFTEESFNKKSHSRIYIRVDLETGSQMQVYVKRDNGSYTLEHSYSAAGLQTFHTTLKIQRADHFQIKFAGTGDFKLYAMQRHVIIGSEI